VSRVEVFTVNDSEALTFHAPPLVLVHVVPDKSSDLVAAPDEVKADAVIAKPPDEKAPAVSVMVCVPLFRASPRVQPPPTPLNVMALNRAFPFEVIVLPVAVALKVIAPV
jgi:hypothetical protein